jgi:putative DNA primase/helicase
MTALSQNTSSASGVASQLGNAKSSGDWWQCSCPCKQNHSHDDKTPSLGVKDGPDGGLIVHCQKGCNNKDIYQAIRALGIDFQGGSSFTENRKGSKVALLPRKNKSSSKKEKEYRYTSEDGEYLYSKIRLIPKSFYFSPKGMNKKFVLYNLPALKKAGADGSTVYLCEGEKDAESLIALGLIATCNPEGASLGEIKWKDSYTESLRGLEVVIFADNDEAGRNQARGVAARLTGKAASVKIVEFPDLPEKGDVTDYLEKHSKEDLLTRVDEAPPYKPSQDIKTFAFTDMGNAERFSHYSDGAIGFCEAWGSWLSYSGKVWKKSDLLVVKRAKEIVNLIPKECEFYSSEKEQTAVYKHYTSSQRASAIQGMISLARPDVVQLEPSGLDANPDLFNANNGTINLKTGELRPFNKGDFLTKICRTNYSSDATCPRWESFLIEIFDGDLELIQYIQRAIGYSMTGHSNERAFFILFGSGSNGKSTFVETVSKVFGEDYSSGMPTEALYAKKQDGGVPNDTARLRGARLVYSSEGEDGKQLAVAKIKKLTGNEKLTTRFMRGEWFDYLVSFKIWFSTNHKPEITETAEAIWDRVKLIPFNVRFTEQQKDPTLSQKLAHEAPGILRWMVEGARAWYQEGLGDCSSVKVATCDYRKDSDLVGRFLEERCEVVGPGEIQAKRLHEAFQTWAKEEAGLTDIMSQAALGKLLIEKGFSKIQRPGNRYFWQGIRQKQDESGSNY